VPITQLAQNHKYNATVQIHKQNTTNMKKNNVRGEKININEVLGQKTLYPEKSR
jgi:hypothetical protein